MVELASGAPRRLADWISSAFRMMGFVSVKGCAIFLRFKQESTREILHNFTYFSLKLFCFLHELSTRRHFGLTWQRMLREAVHKGTLLYKVVGNIKGLTGDSSE